jgi:mono/diheme cytochrome c family protein
MAIQVYRKICIDCHDSDGKGEIGRDLFPKLPDFTLASWQDSRQDSALAASVLNGKGKMPAMKNKLETLDVKEIVAFVRGFRDGKQVLEDEPSEPTPSTSRADAGSRASAPAPAAAPAHRNESQLFRKLCAACHGTDGHGSVARDNFPTLPDFTLDSWQTKRTNAQVLVTILEGKGTGMPSFRGKVNREQARGLVEFIRTFSPSSSRPAAAAHDEFETKFRQLENEIEVLQRQFRALSPPRTKGS